MSIELPKVEIHEVAVPAEPRVITINGLRAIAVTLSVAGMLLIGAGLWGFLTLRSVQNDNRDNITHLRRVTHRLRVLSNPTPSEYRKQLQQGIKRCLQAPECRKLFPGLRGNRQTATKAERRQARELAREAGLPAPHRQLASATPIRPTGSSTKPGRTPTGGRHPPHRNGGGGSGSGGGSSGGAAPSPAGTTPSGGGSGGSPPPVVDAHTNLPAPLTNPTVCTNLAQLNC